MLTVANTDKLIGSSQGSKVYTVSATTGGMLYGSTTPVQMNSVQSSLITQVSPAFSTPRPDTKSFTALHVSWDCF